MHRSLGEHAENRLPLSLEGSFFERVDGVPAQEAPPEDPMLALEFCDGFVGRPVECTVGECALSLEEALARKTSLRGAHEQSRGGEFLVEPERVLLTSAEERRIDLGGCIDALL